MADNFGLKLGIEGEKQFKSALRDINQSFKVLGSEMKLVSSQFDKNDHSQEAVTARSRVLNKQIEEQQRRIATLQAALKNATESFGENDRRTQSWAIQLNNAKADLNRLNKELDENEKALDEDGDEFRDAEKKADNFGDELKDTGNDAEKAKEKFQKVGSVVKGVGKAMAAAMAAVGAATLAAGKKIFDFAQETAKAGDTIDKQSQKMQMSAEDYQKLSYAADLCGTNMATMQKAQKKLMSSGSKLELVDALKQCADSSDVAAAATEMFGAKTAQELLPMLNQGSAGIEEMMNKADELGLVMSNDAVKASAKFNDSLSTLQSTFSAVKNKIVAELLPGLTSIMDGLTGLLAGQEGAEEQIKAGAQELVNSLSSIAPKVVDILMKLVGAVGEIAPTIIDSLVSGISANLPSIVSSASNIALSFLNSLISALPQIGESALSLVMTLCNGILSNLPSITRAAIELVVTLALGIGQALPDLIPTIVDTVLLICEILLDNIDKILMAGMSILEGLITGILKALPKLISKLPKILNGLINYFTKSLPQVISMGVKLTIQLAAGLIKAIPQLVAQLPKIIKSIVSGLKNGLGSMADIGRSLLQGLWNGIANVKDWLVDKIWSLGATITDTLKSILGIHSPSTVFRDEIGKNLALGLGEGFESTMKDVTRTMQDSVPKSFDMSANINTVYDTISGITPTTGTPGGIQLTLHIDNFINQTDRDINALADEISTIIAASIRRKGVAF